MTLATYSPTELDRLWVPIAHSDAVNFPALATAAVDYVLRTMPTLEELSGWPYDENNDSPVITESDIDFMAEIAEADELAEHNWAERDD